MNQFTRWRMIPTSLTSEILEVAFFNEDQGVALVDEAGINTLMRTLDGGSTWNVISTAAFNQLSKSADNSMILAVGEAGVMEIIVPGTNPNAATIPVNHPNALMNVRSGWVDRQTVIGSNPIVRILIASEDGVVHYTTDGISPAPVWTQIQAQAEIGTGNGAYVSDIEVQKYNATDIRGVLLTSDGQLQDMSVIAGVLNVSDNTDADAANVNITAITRQVDKVFALDPNQFELGRINLAAGGDYYDPLNATYSGAELRSMIAVNNRVLGVGPNGDIRLLVLNGGLQTIFDEFDRTQATNPSALHAMDNNQGTQVQLAGGQDGVLYKRNAGVWERFNTGTNSSIYAIDEHPSRTYIVGSDALAIKGNISGEDFVSSSMLPVLGGIAMAAQLNNADLYDVAVKDDYAYAVGANGKVLFNPNVNLLNFAILTYGSSNYYGVAPQISGQDFYIVGQNARIRTHSNASGVINTDVFPPALRDVHFSDMNQGTILADKFTVRKTSNGGTSWQVVTPTSDQAPTAVYTDIRTLSSTFSLVLGQGVPYKVNNQVATAYTAAGAPVNVNAVTGNASELYVGDGTTVKKLTLSASDISAIATLATATNTINDIQVFSNGSYAIVGNTGLFAYYSNTNTQILTPVLPTGENIHALQFFDNINGVLVGDNGKYIKTDLPQPDPNGFLQSTGWNQITITGNADPYNVTDVNLYTVAFSTPNNPVYGGEYVTQPAGTVLHPYVRNAYDPNSRYSARFFYDRLGREILSQNSRQYNEQDKKFSYTLYDALGRVVEVGEKLENPSTPGSAEPQFSSIFGTTVTGFYNPNVIDDANLLAWIDGTGARKEVTRSFYDETLITGVPGFNPNVQTQRKRIVHVTYEAEYDTGPANYLTYDHATHYDYDIHGNVKTLVQDNKKMADEFPSIASQRYKRMDYSFDLVSGNVHRMSVESGNIDQWHHAYKYDADNRIVAAYTTKETPIITASAFPYAFENELVSNNDWENDANYFYYDHGPLARVELGDNQLQGIDYVYNLQGWLKGVNATTLDENLDPGRDGSPTLLSGPGINPNEVFAKDVYSYALHYFEGDYNPIGAVAVTPIITELPAANIANSDVAANSNDLYNGNIKAMQTTLTHPTTYAVIPMANAYKYDQLNRLLESKSFVNLTGNQWGNSGTYDNRYLNTFEYDAMGNILHQNRYTEAGVQIENMAYGYKRTTGGDLLRNRLYHINEPLNLTALDDTDIDDMGGTFNPQDPNIESGWNYQYDEEGRIVKDTQEGIEEIVWRVDGKVKEVIRTSGSDKKNLGFDYDAMGNRIAKHIYNNQTGILEKTVYFLLDANGNQMNVYEREVDNSNVLYTLKERHIYGNSGIGIRMDSLDMNNPIQLQNISNLLGKRYYHLQNHLNNNLTTLSDNLIPVSVNNNIVSGYQVEIVNIYDYTPFGVHLKERTIENDYVSIGFNGMKRDDELKGRGNSYTTEFRQYDTRLGRWLSLDPEFASFPWQSPYVAFDNNPIINTDARGRAAESQTSNPDKRRQKLTIKKSNELLKRGESKKWHRLDKKITRLDKKILGGNTGVNTPELANYGKGDQDRGDDGVGGPTKEYEPVSENFAFNRLGFKAARIDPSGNVDVINVGIVDPANPLVPVWPTGNPYGETPGDPVVSDAAGNILSSTGAVLIPSLNEVSPYDGLYQAGDVKSDGTVAANDEIIRKEVMVMRDASGVVMAKDLGKERRRNITKKVENSN